MFSIFCELFLITEVTCGIKVSLPVWWEAALFPVLHERFALFLLILLEDSFPDLESFSLMPMIINVLLNRQGITSI